LGLVNCELYSAVLIRLVVPSFPNINYLTVSKSFIKERIDQKTLCYQDNDDDVEC
jgi:hypothetical protein